MFKPGDQILVDGIEEGKVLRAVADIVVFRYTTIEGRETEATVNVSRVTLRAENPEIG